MEQHTEEWWQARCGRVTASRIADVMAKTKTGYGAGRKNYMAELLTERLTGEPAPGFSNAAMQWGTDTEPKARNAYQFLTMETVVETGFWVHPEIEWSGASPDGLIGKDGLIEIKCPNSATHIETLKAEKVADKYVKQMQWQMACTGRQWCDFMSFDPRLPDHLQAWITRINRDDELIAQIEEEVRAFLAELEIDLETLQSKYPKEAA